VRNGWKYHGKDGSLPRSESQGRREHRSRDNQPHVFRQNPRKNLPPLERMRRFLDRMDAEQRERYIMQMREVIAARVRDAVVVGRKTEKFVPYARLLDFNLMSALQTDFTHSAIRECEISTLSNFTQRFQEHLGADYVVKDVETGLLITNDEGEEVGMIQRFTKTTRSGRVRSEHKRKSRKLSYGEKYKKRIPETFANEFALVQEAGQCSLIRTRAHKKPSRWESQGEDLMPRHKLYPLLEAALSTLNLVECKLVELKAHPDKLFLRSGKQDVAYIDLSDGISKDLPVPLPEDTNRMQNDELIKYYDSYSGARLKTFTLVLSCNDVGLLSDFHRFFAKQKPEETPEI
jgi:hypothetical protein